MVDCRDPSVTDEQARKAPFLALGFGVALQNGFGEVWNVLAGV